MKFWNCVGEFFLFRWLCDIFQRPDAHGNIPCAPSHGRASRGSLLPKDHDDYHHTTDYFEEEQDDYDMMDDF